MVRIRDWCRDCGEPLLKKEDGICSKCRNERVKERIAQNYKYNKV